MRKQKKIVGHRVVNDDSGSACIHDVPLRDPCKNCEMFVVNSTARSFRDQVEGKSA